MASQGGGGGVPPIPPVITTWGGNVNLTNASQPVPGNSADGRTVAGVYTAKNAGPYLFGVEGQFGGDGPGTWTADIVINGVETRDRPSESSGGWAFGGVGRVFSAVLNAGDTVAMGIYRNGAGAGTFHGMAWALCITG